MTTSTKREAWDENYVQVTGSGGREKIRTKAGHRKPIALFLCTVQFCTLDDKLVEVFFETGFCSLWCGYSMGLRPHLVALINLMANRKVPKNTGDWIFRWGCSFTCLFFSEQRQDGLLYWRLRKAYFSFFKSRVGRGRSRLIRRDWVCNVPEAKS